MKRWRHLKGLIAAFRRDERGASFIEFAILIPVLLVLIMPAAWEITNALIVKRKASQSATILADLATQNASINADMWASMQTMVGHVLYPYDGASHRMQMIGVEVDSARRATLSWTCGTGSLDASSLPAGLLIANSFYVLAETEVDYESSLGVSLVPNMTFKDAALLTPRVSAKISMGTPRCP